MGLETGSYISDLVSTNPLAGDPKSEGDDHLRLLKSVLKTSFPNINGAVTATLAELNGVAIANLAEASGSITPGALWSLLGTTLRKVTKDYAVLNIIASATGAAVAPPATLPAGYRPGASVYAAAYYLDSSTNISYPGYVQISAVGVVTFFTTGAPATAVGDLIVANLTFKLA